jgi:hypothetical protein
MVTRFYVEADNLLPLLQWLQTKPEGKLSVLVGGTDDSVAIILDNLGSDYGLAKWIYDKTLLQEFAIESLPERLELPVGIIPEE